MTYITQYDPTTGLALGTVAEATPDAVRQAMTAARAAFPAWRGTPLTERLRWMKKLREHIIDHAQEIAQEISRATGKPAGEALSAEVFVVADALHYYESHAAQFLGAEKKKTPLLFFGNHSYVQYQPLGVVAVISPWNFPFQLAMIPVISALIAGNCVLLKPSEVTPFIGRLMEDIFQKVGFPSDVLHILHGGREVGQALTASRPDKIFFTGSVATGKKIMAAAAEHLIPVDLELGGKDPMIVFADADLERAANAAVWGAFTNAGQVCMSVERVYVEASLHDEFVRRVVAKTRALRIGEDVGSMTYPPQLELVQRHLADALQKGARLETGGSPMKEGTLYFAPTVLTQVDHGMQIMREETFGPVLPIMPFETEAEAVALANDSDYGLNASVWSQDLTKAKRIAAQLVSGNVCVNEVITTIANPHLPFGGVKQSGMGRYHAGVGLHTFCHQTSVMVNPGRKQREINWFPYTAEQDAAMHQALTLFAGTKKRLTWQGLKHLYAQAFGKGTKTQHPPQSPSGSQTTLKG